VDAASRVASPTRLLVFHLAGYSTRLSALGSFCRRFFFGALFATTSVSMVAATAVVVSTCAISCLRFFDVSHVAPATSTVARVLVELRVRGMRKAVHVRSCAVNDGRRSGRERRLKRCMACFVEEICFVSTQSWTESLLWERPWIQVLE
jgi:hypothetical protein